MRGIAANAKAARQVEGTAMLYICMHLFFICSYCSGHSAKEGGQIQQVSSVVPVNSSTVEEHVCVSKEDTHVAYMTASVLCVCIYTPVCEIMS